MPFKTLTLRNWRSIAALVFISVFSTLFISLIAKASPGAHGPNGEHLDTSNTVLASLNPKFETFTESFELLGELLESNLVIYLHDFNTNTPVTNADIELESGGITAAANYSESLGAYSLVDQTMLELLNQAGEHEIVLTVITEDNGDLLVGNLANNRTEPIGTEAQEEHHHHFPWWVVVLSLGVFIGGFLLGRTTKENK